MLEERDARIAVLEAALEPFAKAYVHCTTPDRVMLRAEPTDNPIFAICTVGDLRRAAAAHPTHSEGGEALRSQAEANVLAVRSWDSPGFPACVKREMEKIKAAIAKRHRDNHDTSPPCAAEPDLELSDVKAALETLGASPSPSALTEEGLCGSCIHFRRERDQFGECLRWHRGYGGTAIKENEVIVEDDEGWGMKVGDKFGCVLHEPARSPKGGTYA